MGVRVRASGERPAWVRTDLEALSRNLERLRRRVAPAGILAVIKADAYGHGAEIVARRLEDEGVEQLGVAFAGEGVRLREAGIGMPVLVLGPTQPEEPPIYRRHRLTPTISSRDQLELWRGWTEAEGARQPVHLKVDTGMNRLGLDPEELPAALAAIRASSGLELTGLLSHLGDADTPESPRNEAQIERFAELVGQLTDAERQRTVVHLANSGGALYLEGATHTRVRLGLALYGCDPLPPGRSATGGVELEPVMRVAARIVLVREVPVGSRVGYGGTWQAARPTRLAVVPIGYGDGYSWRLSNRAEALVGGRRVPVVGRVSMDMLTLDVTDVGDGEARVGSEAVLLGRQGAEEITAWELAERSGTLVWEVLCRFGLRLTRRPRGGVRSSG